MTVPRRAFAAAVTPLLDSAGTPDLDGIAKLLPFYAAAGLDGLLILGTTGEGVLLSRAARHAVAEEFMRRAPSGMDIFVHCGAQSTHDTVELCEHAARIGAAGVAVIAPPYYALDADSLLQHFSAAAAACAPLPFYVYEFAQRSGYAVPVSVVEALRETASNLAGLKVSDSPFERVEPYLMQGLDVFIGAEELIHRGLDRGASGAVSGLAAALPEYTLRVVRNASAEAAARAGAVRAAVQRFPFQAALKRLLQLRGVAIGGAVAAPLRTLNADELTQLEALYLEIADDLDQSTAVSTTEGPSKRSSASAAMSNVEQR